MNIPCPRCSRKDNKPHYCQYCGGEGEIEVYTVKSNRWQIPDCESCAYATHCMKQVLLLQPMVLDVCERGSAKAPKVLTDDQILAALRHGALTDRQIIERSGLPPKPTRRQQLQKRLEELERQGVVRSQIAMVPGHKVTIWMTAA